MLERIAVVGALTALVAAIASSPTPARTEKTKPQLVRTIVDERLGRVLTTVRRQAIYVWNREPKGTVRCTRACAEAWPPVLVGKRVAVRAHVKGIAGIFGTIRRPDGKRQLTHNRRPLYTYAHERPGQVLCNDVDGWFAVKARP